MNDDDTMQAPPPDEPETTASAAGAYADTNIVEPAAKSTEGSDLAWSLGDDQPEYQSWRSTWGRMAIILSCVAVLGGAIGVVLWLSGLSGKDAQPRSTVTVTAAPPPPVTITVMPAPPVTVTPPPSTPTATQDEQFWRLFHQDVPTETNREWAIKVGHSVCPEMEGLHLAGYQVEDQISHSWAIPASTAAAIHGAAVTAYCPQLMGQ